MAELKTQVLIARQLDYLITESELLHHIDNLFGKLGALIKSQQTRMKSE